MALFTLQQRIFLVKKYYQSNNSIEIVQNEFSSVFRKRSTPPTSEIILGLVASFEKYGTIRRRPKDKIIETVNETDDPVAAAGNVESDDESISSVKQVIPTLTF